MLAEYQAVAAEAAWSGGRRDAVRALAANPLVMRLDLPSSSTTSSWPPTGTCSRTASLPRPMAGLLLGADGGNTKTIALVAGRDGTILGAGRAGTSDLYNAVSVGAAIGAIGAAVAAALDAAGASAADVEAACFSLAGADWPEDFELLRRELRRRSAFPASRWS